MLVPNRHGNSGEYRYGFNGKEKDDEINGQGNSYDYGFRMYNAKVSKFMSVDPLTSKYPHLTPYQFASDSPIAGIDLDGLEHYMTITGHYLGKPANSTSEELRVVTEADSKKYSEDVNKMHGAVAYKTLPVYSYSLETKEISKSSMTMDHLLDLTHIIYGEDKGNDTNSYAHLLFNREIKFAKLADKWDGSIIKYADHPKNQQPIYKTKDNSTLLYSIDKYGFQNAILYGTYMPNDKTALENFRKTLDVNGVQIDAGVQNKGYSEFFKLKNDPKTLEKTLKPVKDIFKSIIDARLGKTTDPNPNYDGWRASGPRKEVQGDSETLPTTSN